MNATTMSAADFIDFKAAAFANDLAADRLLVMKDIDRQGFHLWRREAWTLLVQTGLRTKVFVIERLAFVGSRGQQSKEHREGREAEPIRYRFGYWIVARNGGPLGDGGGPSSRR